MGPESETGVQTACGEEAAAKRNTAQRHWRPVQMGEELTRREEAEEERRRSEAVPLANFHRHIFSRQLLSINRIFPIQFNTQAARDEINSRDKAFASRRRRGGPNARSSFCLLTEECASVITRRRGERGRGGREEWIQLAIGQPRWCANGCLRTILSQRCQRIRVKHAIR